MMKKILFYILHVINMLRCKKIMYENRNKIYKYDAAICAIAKCEDDYLEEWIDYHLQIGFQHIFLVDNNDSDSVEKLLNKYVDEGYLTILPFRGIPHVQAQAYEYVTQFYGEETKWLALIDIDEFFVMKRHNSIIQLLKEYEDIPSISVNWLCFGCNGHICKSEGDVVKRFTRPASLSKSNLINYAVKSIIRPSIFIKIYDASFRNVHRWSLPTFNEKRQIIHQNTHKPSYECLYINHYYTKSYEEFKKKRQRGTAMFKMSTQDYDSFFLVNEKELEKDIDIYENSLL